MTSVTNKTFTKQIGNKLITGNYLSDDGSSFVGTIDHPDGLKETGYFQTDLFGRVRSLDNQNYTRYFPDNSVIKTENGTFFDRLKSRFRNIFGQDTSKINSETGQLGILGNLKEGTREYKDGTIHKGKFDIFGNLKEGTISHGEGKNFEYVGSDEIGRRKTFYFDKNGKLYKTNTKNGFGDSTTEGIHEFDADSSDLINKIKSAKLKKGKFTSKLGSSKIEQTGEFIGTDFTHDPNLVKGKENYSLGNLTTLEEKKGVSDDNTISSAEDIVNKTRGIQNDTSLGDEFGDSFGSLSDFAGHI